MLRRLLFPTVAFLLFAAAVIATPQPATAFVCNHKYCNEEYQDCWGLRYWNCIDTGPLCGDQIC
jgi:hypothetical protein